jgi:TRAP-type C4-dicarboxylate transport system permease small subunit
MVKFDNILGRVCEVVLVLFLTAMAIVVFMQVIFRYLLSLPLFWTEEFARYCLVWASLMGAAVAVKRGQHIAVTWFVERLPYRIGRVLGLTARISVAVILAVVMWGGIKLVAVTSAQISPALRIPMAVPYMALPIGSGIMLYHVITSIFHRPT